VYGIEVVEAAVKDARANAKINGIENAEFITGLAEEVMPRLYREGIRPHAVVLDPPRKGCDRALLDSVASMQPERVVYVSCNPATLARDLKYLDGRGYKTQEVQPVDMFPHTAHVECVVLMSRVDK
jgi:23S rRNA (uracil1939-C5)-methyltransferase